MTVTSYSAKKTLPTRAERFLYELEQNINGLWEVTIYDRSRQVDDDGYIGTLNLFYSSERAIEAGMKVAEIYKKDYKEELHRTEPTVINSGVVPGVTHPL